MMNQSIETKSTLYKKTSKGELAIVGSGKYLREQKSLLSTSKTSPYDELYRQHVKEAIKDSSESLRACFVL